MIGVGLDHTLGLGMDDQIEIAGAEAARLGYTSVWTPEGRGLDAIHLSALRWQGSRTVVDGGIGTGIGVIPLGHRGPIAMAMQAATMGVMTGGGFTLGVGISGNFRASARKTIGLPGSSGIRIVGEYVDVVRALLRGDTVDHEGETLELHGIALAVTPPPTPVHIGALGPNMLRLAGRSADGVVLNWTPPDHVAWSRDRITEGAAEAGRDPGDIEVVQYIRVCVDDDAEAARAASAEALAVYALGRAGMSDEEAAWEVRFGYQAHMDRLGFGEALAEVRRMHQRRAPMADIAAAFPDEVLSALACYGDGATARAAFDRLKAGNDVAIVRIIAARPGLEGVVNAMEALAPR